MGWKADKEKADRFLPEIERVIRSIAGDIIEVKESELEKDQQCATDYVITIDSGDIACRVRKYHYWKRFADVTLRYRRPSGRKTEFEKIKAGYARWYLYAWREVSWEPKFCAWIFLDLDILRKCGLLNGEQEEIWNHDHSSSFVSLSLAALWTNECIIRANDTAYEKIAKKLMQ